MSGPESARRAGLRGVVGIDLGTSHTSLAFAECRADASVEALPIAQWVQGRRRDQHVLLPSVAYAPLEGELPNVPATPGTWVIGEYARARSQETLGRAIASAKSWLCHAGVDRAGPILPWGSALVPDAEKLSPVDVSRRILAQAMQALGQHRPGFDWRDLAVVITVPASFDQTARKLTVMAAERAGLSARLLEEPQAAFYDYLASERSELEALAAARGPLRVLVCDIGGGTTDLSLIDVSLESGALSLRRSAVGRHLLLGGDNMDLAVARLAESKLGEALDPARLGQLRTAARGAKEVLLAEGAPPSATLRLLDKGAALFTSSIGVELAREEVRALVLDGFFPATALDELPEARRAGLTTLGLPFERDPAVTRHIAEFLRRHAGGKVPDALLFNGGVMRSPLVRERLRECLSDWGEREVVVLSARHPELAVCRGAVRYGLALAGFGSRIEGGTAQGYYVAIESSESGAREALCVVPRGSKEGERHVLGGRRFELLVGRPARFQLYAHDSALHAPGARVSVDAEYQPLPALTTVPELDQVPADTRVLVQLDGELSAVGTVELGCTVDDPAGAQALRPAEPNNVEESASNKPPHLAENAPASPVRAGAFSQPGGREMSSRRFQLAFELGAREPRPVSEAPRRLSVRPLSSLDPQRWLAAEEALMRVFGKGRKDVGPREPKDLLRTLERGLGARRQWDLELSRKLADLLLAAAKARSRSEDHERMFWMLAGFCLRPGFGHARDAERVAALWQCFDAGLTHRDAERSWQQYWIAWRRVAGGLSESMQTHLRDAIDPSLAPAELKLKKPKHLRAPAAEDLLELGSHLERLPHARRAALGGWLLDRTWSDRDPRLWTYIGRLGARVPVYASAHHVLPGSVVERWIEPLLRERWSEVSTAAASAFSLARVTGDETRDVSPRLRAEVARALERAGAPAEWRRAVLEHVPVSLAEREAQLGEDLPLGLRLVDE